MGRPQKISEYLKYNILSFKLTGIWIDITDLKQSSWSTIFYSVTVNALFILAPQICHVIYMYKARDNVKNFADEFHVSLTSIMVVFKSFSLVRHSGVIRKLVDAMDSDLFQPKRTGQVDVVHKIMGTWRKIYWFYAYLVISFCCMQLLSPAVDTFIYGKRLLPLVDCYPFEIFISPTYEMMYVYQSLALFWLVCQNFNVDTLITSFLTFAAAQCEILCDDLENLKPDTLVEDEDGLLETKLVDCIKHHKEISRFIKDVEYCFSLNLFEQFAVSVITFCTTMFIFTLTEPMSQEFFTIIFYQGACFLELFIFCWTGSELTAKSEKISWAAYDTNWFNNSRMFKKNLVIFHHSTQIPFRMKAVLFPVSLDIFLQIIKSSFSYYAVLTTLHEK